MFYFVIRRKSDGYVLPAKGRGATYAEPVDPSDKPPRLFTKKAHAKAALEWWLAGETYNAYRYSEDGDVDLRTRPRPDRRAEDWDVEEVRIFDQDDLPMMSRL